MNGIVSMRFGRFPQRREEWIPRIDRERGFGLTERAVHRYKRKQYRKKF